MISRKVYLNLFGPKIIVTSFKAGGGPSKNIVE